MQRLSLPLGGQAHSSVLNRLWRSLQAGVQCESAADAGSAFSGQAAAAHFTTTSFGSPNSPPTSSPRFRSHPPSSSSFHHSENPPHEHTRGFAASAANGSLPAVFESLSETEGGDGCPSSLAEYNEVLTQLSRKLQSETMRDVFDDLVLDGLTPDRSTYHLLIGACMRTRSLQDVLFFYDRMMMQGLIPDATLFHIILRACARARQSAKAFEVAEEMETVGAPTTSKTYLHLLNVCAKTGQVDKANVVVAKMKSKGLVLDKYCYAALIEAIGNQKPHPGRETTARAILGMFEEARKNRDAWTDPYEYIPKPGHRGRSWPEHYLASEEQESVPAEYAGLIVYKAAVDACAAVFYKPGVHVVLRALKEDGLEPDAELMYVALAPMLSARDFDAACDLLDQYPRTRIGITSDSIKKLLWDAVFSKRIDLVTRMFERLLDPKTRTYLSARDGNDLLNLTDRRLRKVDFKVCRMMWDILKGMNIKVWLGPAKDHLRAVMVNKIPEDDPHYIEVKACVDAFASRTFSNERFRPEKQIRDQVETDDLDGQ